MVQAEGIAEPPIDGATGSDAPYLNSSVPSSALRNWAGPVSVLATLGGSSSRLDRERVPSHSSQANSVGAIQGGGSGGGDGGSSSVGGGGASDNGGGGSLSATANIDFGSAALDLISTGIDTACEYWILQCMQNNRLL